MCERCLVCVWNPCCPVTQHSRGPCAECVCDVKRSRGYEALRGDEALEGQCAPCAECARERLARGAEVRDRVQGLRVCV